MSPLPKNPQQGDIARLQQLASGLKQSNGTYGPTVQRNDVGRPTGITGIPAPRQSQGQNQQVSITPDMDMAAKEVATAEWARQYWARMAAQFPSAWTQLYAEQADSVARAIHEKYYQSTPNFED